MSTRLTSVEKSSLPACSTRITSGISIPTSKPIANTSAYSTVRNGADSHAKTTNNTIADRPPSRPTSSSMSTKRASTSSSFT